VIGAGCGARSGWGWRRPLNKGQPVAKPGTGNTEDATEAADGLGWKWPLSRPSGAKGIGSVVREPGAGIRGGTNGSVPGRGSRRMRPTGDFRSRHREGASCGNFRSRHGVRAGRPHGEYGLLLSTMGIIGLS
jgi:hypothetical protein